MTLFTHWLQVSLRAKLTLLIETLLIIIAVVTGILAAMDLKNTLEVEIYKRGLAVAKDLARLSVNPLLSKDLTTLGRLVNDTMTQEYVLYAAILDLRGTAVMHSDFGKVGKIYRDDVIQIAINARESGCALQPLTGKNIQCHIYAPIEVSKSRLGTVLLGYSYEGVKNVISRAEQRILYIGLGTIIVGGIMAYLLATFILLPIKKTAARMEKVSKGDLATISDIKRNDEIGNLVNSFNQMATDLGNHRLHLEVLVVARTSELIRANERLHQEIIERSRAQEELKQSQEQLRHLASYLQHIREEERTQISREIHDELGQALTAIKMDIHWLGIKLPKDQQVLFDKMQSMSKLIDQTVQTVRRISSELRPKLLDDLGLSAAIEWQAGEFSQRAGVPCAFRSEPDDIILDKARSTAFFRIFQETLTNIARHAQATRVEVSLKKDDTYVEMTVRDNGKGITEKAILDAKALGITGMRERAYALGGDFKITGVPNIGTTVKVSIPLGETGVAQ